MGVHHLALATRDIEATHRFYTEVMGFELVKVQVGATPSGGWAKHLFYDTGHGGCIAFWDLHDETIGEFNPSISGGLGLPAWVNHLAFMADDLDDLDAKRDHWLDQGCVVTEIDHVWCKSVYTMDPNGTLVEWCFTTQAFTADDKAEALRLLKAEQPPLEPDPEVRVLRPQDRVQA